MYPQVVTALSPRRERHRCLLSMAGHWKLHDNFGLLLCKSKSTAFHVRGTGEVTMGHLAVYKFGEAAVWCLLREWDYNR